MATQPHTLRQVGTQLPPCPGQASPSSPGNAQQEEVELVSAGQLGSILREGAQVFDLRGVGSRRDSSFHPQEAPKTACWPHSPYRALWQD